MGRVLASLRSVSDNGTDGLPVTDAPLVPLGYTQLPLSSTVATTLNPPAGATWLELCVENQSIRYRDDGVAPTATVGQLYAAGTVKMLSLTTLGAVQVIGTQAGAILNCLWYQT